MIPSSQEDDFETAVCAEAVETTKMEVCFKNFTLANLSGRKKTNAVWGFFRKHPNDSNYWYCTECFGNPLKDLYRRQTGVVNYNSYNTTALVQHAKKSHSMAYNKFDSYMKGATENERKRNNSKERKSKKKLKISSTSSVTGTTVLENNSQSASMISSYIKTTKPYPMNSEIQQRYEKSLC